MTSAQSTLLTDGSASEVRTLIFIQVYVGDISTVGAAIRSWVVSTTGGMEINLGEGSASFEVLQKGFIEVQARSSAEQVLPLHLELQSVASRRIRMTPPENYMPTPIVRIVETLYKGPFFCTAPPPKNPH